ncbi:hypothetical protein LOD99_4836 [Oopsacas minuta]|uniref:Leucine-rich repeat-containing protein 56 n=1 Tax=Oopsacas minuta TaxID=111878 RepID=A0AAV7JRZ7_9METZ|nr:hypothetical protein LOD99_4836 [Oopsacas minuta]
MEQTESNSPLSSSLSVISSFTPENESPTPRLSLFYLQQITELQCLSDSFCLEVSLNANEIAIDNIGELLPNLSMLKLTIGSIIPSLRCLGSGLHALRYLYAPQCSIELIEGIGTISQLQELYLPFNHISDLSPLSVLENLTIVDIEYNEVMDKSQLTHLALCNSLTTLSMNGNPICEEFGDNFTQELQTLVPSLVRVEGIDFPCFQNEDNTKIVSNPTLHLPSPPTIAPSLVRRPKTSLGTRQKASSFNLTSDRVSDLKRSLIIPQRPKTASGDFTRSFTPGIFYETMGSYSKEVTFENEEGASYLTQGPQSSLCGSLTQSLRAKKGKKKHSKAKLEYICEGLEADSIAKDNSTAINTEKLDSVLEDLHNWRLRFDINTDLISDIDSEIS